MVVMTDAQLGRAVRALRHRRNWTQAQLARRSRCSASTISRFERGRVGSCSVRVVRRILEALDAWILMKVVWRGGELDRLLDADHAVLQERWAARKHSARAGWDSRTEVTYNVFGERGSIDDLSFHEPSGTLLVTELKTGIYSADATIAKLDEKVRLAPSIARRFGWRAVRVVPCLVVAEGRTNRRRVAGHPAMFGAFQCRGWGARRWLADPSEPVGGLLMFEYLSQGHGEHGRRAGRQRVRHARRALSVSAGAEARHRPPTHAYRASDAQSTEPAAREPG